MNNVSDQFMVAMEAEGCGRVCVWHCEDPDLDLWESSSGSGEKSEEDAFQNNLAFGFLTMVEAGYSSSGSSPSSKDASHL